MKPQVESTERVSVVIILVVITSHDKVVVLLRIRNRAHSCDDLGDIAVCDLLISCVLDVGAWLACLQLVVPEDCNVDQAVRNPRDFQIYLGARNERREKRGGGGKRKGEKGRGRGEGGGRVRRKKRKRRRIEGRG
jgi:hypothetical protein